MTLTVSIPLLFKVYKTVPSDPVQFLKPQYQLFNTDLVHDANIDRDNVVSNKSTIICPYINIIMIILHPVGITLFTYIIIKHIEIYSSLETF